MPKISLIIKDDMIRKLENIKRKYQPSVTNLKKAWFINEVASVLNNFWKNKIAPSLEDKPLEEFYEVSSRHSWR